MIQKNTYILILSFFLLASCNSTKYVKKNEHLLNSYEIKLDNPKLVNVDNLYVFVKQKPNTKFFEYYPFYLNVFYNWIDPLKEEKREIERAKEEKLMNHKRELKGKAPREKFYWTRWIRGIGEAPVIYSENLTKATVKEFQKYLLNRGFYSSVITDTVTFKDKTANLTYLIKTGKPRIIESVEYDIPNAKIANLLASKIPNLPIKKGLRMDTDSMQSQRMYITDYLKDNGYYLFQKEYIYYEADTTLPDNKVALKIRMQKQLKKDENGSIIKIEHQHFSIGEIKMFTDFDPKVAIFDSTNYFQNLTEIEYENYSFYHRNKRKLFHPSVLTRGLKIYEDSIFNLSKTKTSRQYLSSLGIFKTVNVSFNPIEKENGEDILDCKIQLTPSVPQSYKLELEGSISGGWRTETSLNYKHRNLFKSASLLNLTFSSAFEKINNLPIRENRFFNNEKYGVELGITIPKFLSPFKLTTFNKKYLPKTNISLKYDYQRRSDYTRTVTNGSYGYFWKSSEFVSHSIKLADIYSTEIPQMDTSYLAYLISSNDFDRFFDHIILGSSYTYLYTNKKQTRRINFNFFKFNVEWAGNLLFAAHELSKTEKTKGSEIFSSIISPYAEILKDDPSYINQTREEIEADLAISLDNDYSAYTILNLDYKQYVKTNFDFHQTFFLSGKKSWAYRVAGGIIIPYGNSESAPIIKQYYVGGANSMRAWAPRQVGPGARQAEFDENGDLLFYESYGDINLEANAEFRFNIWWMFDGAIFADAGNIWALDNLGIQDNPDISDIEKTEYFSFNSFYKEIAVNTGLGLRMDMDFLVVRFDVGIPLIDPRLPAGNTWVWGQSNSFFKQPKLVFGIGLPF